MSRILSFIALLLLCGTIGCREKVRMKPTPEEKKVADSLYATTYNNIKDETDSICEAIHDSLFLELVDSISAVRLSEVEKLINEK